MLSTYLPKSTSFVPAGTDFVPAGTDLGVKLLKLMPSSNNNLIGVISFFVSYWPPPAIMDVVSVTIVAGGRA